MASANSPRKDASSVQPQNTPAGSKDLHVTPAESGKWYSCTYCQQSFTRVDHLTRHVRSRTYPCCSPERDAVALGACKLSPTDCDTDTGETFYKCNICLKTFSRPDIVRRHAATHAPKSTKESEQQKKDAVTAGSGRVLKACKACTTAKLKCQEEKPCQRCKQKGLACETMGPRERHAPIAVALPASEQNENASVATSPAIASSYDSNTLISHSQGNAKKNAQTGCSRKRTLDTMQEDDTFPSNTSTRENQPPDTTQTEPKIVPSLPDDISIVPGAYFKSDAAHLTFFEDDEDAFMTQFWQELPSSDLTALATSSDRLWMSSEGNDTTSLPTLGLDMDGDFDFGPLDSLSETLGASRSSCPPPRTDPVAVPPEDSLELYRMLTASIDVLKRTASSGLVSTQESQVQLRYGYLHISEEDSATVERQFSSLVSLSREKLSSRARDQILVMVLRALPQGDPSSVVSEFPTVEVLDVLLQSFLIFIFEQMDSMLHFPTLKPNCQTPELLCSLIAAGASETRLPSVRAFGVALQDVHLKHIDVPMAAWANLHHFWGLFWDSRRLLTWSCARSGNPTAAMNLWPHDDLCRWLTLFKLEVCEWPLDPTYEVQFLNEVLSMYLHLPVDFHTLFASTDGCGDVAELLASIKLWVRNEGSRHAVWFASQALQISKLFPRKLLKDIHATALYHVFLTLWLYGIGLKAQESDLLDHAMLPTAYPFFPMVQQDTPPLWLDGAETAEVKKYIVLGVGNPTLKNKHAEAVPLACPEAVTKLVTGVLSGNHPCDPPAHVLNLLLGMKEICRVGDGRAVGP
ncbi:hypothetical protein LTS15_004728 [Exophiala xenobiotica]|nr:hypothetical protein LTS15_004728 [Exophiala xenobiotica]